MSLENKHFQNSRIQQFIEKQISTFLHNNKFATILMQRMQKESGLSFADWANTIILPYSPKIYKKIEKIGYQVHPSIENYFYTPDFHFPRITVGNNALEIIIYVESLPHFCLCQKLIASIEGEVGATRRMQIYNHRDYVLNIIEKPTLYPHTLPSQTIPQKIATYLQAKDLWCNRKRHYSLSQEGIKQILALAYRVVDMVGIDAAAQIVLQAEREYWEIKCAIGHLQKFFQNRLGLGYNNCDYYTFLSSRENFMTLVQIFETLGFRCTRKIFAKDYGNKGIQILEHPHSNTLIKCGVHLKKKESKIDFAHTALPPMTKTGLVDNWIKKNGESILQGGIKEVGLRCTLKHMQPHMKLYGIHFTDIVNTAFFKQVITGNHLYSKQENYLSLVEKKAGFKYFLFD